MKCKECDKNIEEDSKFCPFCGNKIEVDDKSPFLEVEKEILDHLEFLGYEINKPDANEGDLQYFSAIHKGSKPNLILNNLTEIGTTFVTFYNLDEEKVKKNRKEILEIINRMNNQAFFCSFSITPASNKFVCSALYLGKYNKKQFADFLDLFELDLQKRLKEESYLDNFT